MTARILGPVLSGTSTNRLKTRHAAPDFFHASDGAWPDRPQAPRVPPAVAAGPPGGRMALTHRSIRVPWRHAADVVRRFGHALDRPAQGRRCRRRPATLGALLPAAGRPGAQDPAGRTAARGRRGRR